MIIPVLKSKESCSRGTHPERVLLSRVRKPSDSDHWAVHTIIERPNELTRIRGQYVLTYEEAHQEYTKRCARFGIPTDAVLAESQSWKGGKA